MQRKISTIQQRPDRMFQTRNGNWKDEQSIEAWSDGSVIEKSSNRKSTTAAAIILGRGLSGKEIIL